tara:strand:+ start:4826 stop:6298 length:1473 start_codon:yes stop_codon:yes gene_type:complete
MKNTLLFIHIFLISSAIAIAQTYTTPNTGVTWTLDDIASNSPSTITVSGTNYSLLENLEIAANDTVIIDSDLTLSIDEDLLVTVFGTFTVNSNAVTITAINQTAPYEGFRFEEFSEIEIRNATIEYGGGLRVLTEDFIIDNSDISNNVAGGATTGAVISLSRGMPEITNNTISFNELPAVSSAANSQVSALIANNIIEGNNQSNSNRPQINMGTTMAAEPLQILNNTILGDRALDMVGGIAVANLVGGSINVIIDDNVITDNRYGMTIIGPSDSALVRNNIIEDNDSQGDPFLGGSGISLNTSTAGNPVIASGNEFRRNLWGITVIGSASINLGDDVDNPGENIFSENGNGGEVFALYNNTALPITAKHNCWIEGQQSTAAQVEDVIFHMVDDGTLGEVVFDPFICGILDVAENSLTDFSFYPNPATDRITFNNNFSFEKIEVFGLQGNLLLSEEVMQGQNSLSINLSSGMYLVIFSNNSENVTVKMLVE